MKKSYLKIFLTIVALLLGYIVIDAIMGDGKTDAAGTFELIIMDESETIVFNEDLTYKEGQSFFDVLRENFELTCANRNYRADSTCSYKFSILQHKSHVILGIKSDNFEIVTDWDNTFLKIEVYDNHAYVASNVGFDYVDLEQSKKIRIRAEKVA